MARGDRRRTVREAVELADNRQPELREGRRFYTAQGFDGPVRTARALTEAFGAGTKLYQQVLEDRNVKGAQRAAHEKATGVERDLDEKTKGYIEAWDMLDAEDDLRSMRNDLREVLRGANWEELEKDEVQGLIDGYMQEQWGNINPESAFARVWTPGALKFNAELLQEWDEMQLANIQTEQLQKIYGSIQERIDETGEFPYAFAAEMTGKVFDGPQKRTAYIESVFHHGITTGRPDIIENAPEYFTKPDGSQGDPTGIRADLDAYRAAINAATQKQAAMAAAAQKEQEAKDKATVNDLQYLIYAKRLQGADYTPELAMLRGMWQDGRAEFDDFSSAKSFADGQLTEAYEHSPNYDYASALWRDIYNGDANYKTIYRAREDGFLGAGKPADDLMSEMMGVAKRVADAGEKLSGPEVTQFRASLMRAYDPALEGIDGPLDPSYVQVRNLAVNGFNELVMEGVSPDEAFQKMTHKYDALLEGMRAEGQARRVVVAGTTSSEFARDFVITPEVIQRVLDGKESWQVATAGIPNSVVLGKIEDAYDSGLINDEQLAQLGITIE